MVVQPFSHVHSVDVTTSLVAAERFALSLVPASFVAEQL